MGIPTARATLIEQIRSDAVSGSTSLTVRAAEALRSVADDEDASTPKKLLEDLVAASKALIEAQPYMAGIFNLANAAVTNVCQHQSIKGMREALRSSCREFVLDLEHSLEAIADRAASLVKDERVVLTHSYSSVVAQTLFRAAATNKKFSVVCTESPPMFEGVTLAENLRASGIRVTVIADEKVHSFIPHSQLVIVGADSVSPQGVVNKIGTAGIARFANGPKIPFYVLTGREKFLPSLDPGIPSSTGFFDRTPLDLVTGIVTESAILSPAELKSHFSQIQIHELLQ